LIKKFNVEKTKQLNKINKILSVFFKKPIAVNQVPLAEVKNILVIDFALMGDMIMDIPFFKTIKRNCPNAKITMVCMPWAEIILGDQGLIDEFIIFNGKDYISSSKNMLIHQREIRSALTEINKKKYDIGFEPKGDLRHTLFMRYTNCSRTITYNYTGGEYLVTDSFTPRDETRHLIDEKIDLLEMSGFKIEKDDMLPRLELSDEWRKYVENFCIENVLEGTDSIIGIHPGASNRNKQYRYYPELIERIDAIIDKEYLYFVFEGPGEENIVDEVTGQLEKIGRRYIRIKRKVKEYVSLVSKCRIMICNDSAAGHIAAAYGIPALIIFGPVKPETALPRGQAEVMYVSHNFNCKPCTLPECPLGTEECIKSISVEEVYDKFGDLLGKLIR